MATLGKFLKFNSICLIAIFSYSKLALANTTITKIDLETNNKIEKIGKIGGNIYATNLNTHEVISMPNHEEQSGPKQNSINFGMIRFFDGNDWYGTDHDKPITLIDNDQCFTTYTNYIKTNFNHFNKYGTTLTTTQNFIQDAHSANIQTVYAMATIPNTFAPEKGDNFKQNQDNKKRILPKHNIQPYACFVAALADVVYSKDKDSNYNWIDLSNEPDYLLDTVHHGSGSIPPDEYPEFIIQVRNYLNKNGLSNIKLMGPGTSYLRNPDNNNPSEYNPWFTAIMNNPQASNDLAAFDFHAWHKDMSWPGSGAHDVWKSFMVYARSKTNKPIFLSEFSTLPPSYSVTNPPQPNDKGADGQTQICASEWHQTEAIDNNDWKNDSSWCSDSNKYLYGTAIIHNFNELASLGVSKFLLWNLADNNPNWDKRTFGLLEASQSPNMASKRPSYFLIQFINNYLNTDSMTLSGSNDGVGAYYSPSIHSLIVLMPNYPHPPSSDDHPQNFPVPQITQSIQFRNGHLQNVNYHVYGYPAWASTSQANKPITTEAFKKSSENQFTVEIPPYSVGILTATVSE